MGTLHDDRYRGGRGIHLLLPLLFLVLLIGVCATAPSFPTANAAVLETSLTISICGNGITDTGEACDSGLGNNTGLYASSTQDRTCAPDCLSFGPYCGDGVLQARFSEECDNGAGNSTAGSLCNTQCKSVPPAPPPSPSVVLGTTPYVPGATQGTISAQTQTQVVLRGKAYPNTDVQILLDGKAFGVVRADSNADFLFNTNSVAPGTATFSLWAKDAKGVASITTSVIFDVVQSAVTNVNNIFLPPTLSTSDRQIAPGGLLTLSGQSVPTAKVITNVDADTSNALASIADNTGTWALQLDSGSLAVGFHTAKAFFTLGAASRSGSGKSVSFYVGNQLPAGGPSPDMNHDGKVNLVDFSIFLLSWGTHDILADFNQDGAVNLADFSIMLFDWTG